MGRSGIDVQPLLEPLTLPICLDNDWFRGPLRLAVVVRRYRPS